MLPDGTSPIVILEQRGRKVISSMIASTILTSPVYQGQKRFLRYEKIGMMIL
jgi:hypothetical protein